MIKLRVALAVLSATVCLGAANAGAQCTGWPVTCTGIHPGMAGGIGGGGMNAAGAAFDIGFTILNIMMQSSAPPQTPPTPPAQPSLRIGSYGTAPADNPPPPTFLTLQEKSSLVNQIRPVSATTTTGSYGTSAPSAPPSTSTVEAEKAAILGQFRGLSTGSTTSTGGTGMTPGQQAGVSRNLNDTGENASANARKPFDTGADQQSRTVADQLCQAAGRANGCIGSFTGSPNQTAPAGPPSLPIASTATGVVSLPPDGKVCGVDVPADQSQLVTGPDPLRSRGFPIAEGLEQLLTFDYSDIKANLAAMTPLQLAKMQLAARQQAARAAAATDGLLTKAFQSGLAAATPIPVKSLVDSAKDTIIDAIKSRLPGLSVAEELGRNEGWASAQDAAAKLKLLKEYADTGGKIGDKFGNLLEFLDKQTIVPRPLLAQSSEPKSPEPALPGMKKLSLIYLDSLVHGTLAVDSADKGHWGDASIYAANAVQDLRPLANVLLSKEALETLTKLDKPLDWALFAVDVTSTYGKAYLDKKELLDKKAKGQELSLALARRLAALRAKQDNLENLARMIAEQPRCAR